MLILSSIWDFGRSRFPGRGRSGFIAASGWTGSRILLTRMPPFLKGISGGLSAFKPGELLAISEEIGKKHSPLVLLAFRRSNGKAILTAKELLEISLDISKNYFPELSASTPKVALLPVDPAHLLISWKLAGEASRDALLKAGQQNLVLRIYPELEALSAPAKPALWFDTFVEPEETRKNITVPPDFKAGSYMAAIGVMAENGQFTALARSKAAYAYSGESSAGLHLAGRSSRSAAYSSGPHHLPDNRNAVSSRLA